MDCKWEGLGSGGEGVEVCGWGVEGWGALQFSLILELFQLILRHSSEGKPHAGLTVLHEEGLDLHRTTQQPLGSASYHTRHTAPYDTGHTTLNVSHFRAERRNNFYHILLQWCH